MNTKYQGLGRILVVDDDVATATFIAQALAAQGMHTDAVYDLQSMWVKLRSLSIDILLLDMQLGDEDALDSLTSIVRECPYTKILIVTGHGSIDTAVEAMEHGASGYITKPVDLKKLVAKIESLLGSKKHTAEVSDRMNDSGIIGSSPSMRDVWDKVLRMKDVDSTVLILGESGTGKELIARALHNLSYRSSERFEAINCGAIPSELLESELFGHKKGSFTDAKADKKGLFEICSQGTLFLDEVGELPLLQQTKLLRVLQEKEFTPIGSNRSVKINTRVIAATNISLPEAVRSSKFREDLFFRLSVLVIHLPPLRERRQDIPLLVRHFVDIFSRRFQRDIVAPSSDLLTRLSHYDWHGNIRQLQNAVERGVVLSQDDHLHIEDMLFDISFSSSETLSGDGDMLANQEMGFGDAEDGEILPLSEAREGFEVAYLKRLLTATRGNISEAARLSGRYRADLYRLFSRYKIDPSTFKSSAKTVNT